MSNGNKHQNFIRLGASNHSLHERQEDDFYATEPKAMWLLMDEIKLTNVLEGSCGTGHLSKEMIDRGIRVTSSDLVD